MQRFAAHFGLSTAAWALAMLVGVQFGHSPLHHVAEHVAAHAAHAHGAEGHHHHGCHHGHHHRASGHHHHDGPSDAPLDHHDHASECQLCDLALSPATLATLTTLEQFESLVVKTPQLAREVLESADRWVAPARGPPALLA